MKRIELYFILFLTLSFQSCCFLGIGDCDDEIEKDAITLSQVATKSELPSKITISFKADYKDGTPVVNIDNPNLRVYEGNELISSFESLPKIVTQPTNFAFSTVLLLDLSGSILASNSLPPLQQASKAFINSLFTNTRNGSYEMAIYWFDGESKIHRLKDFTSDKNSLLQSIDSIDKNISTDNSTNLNGAIIEGVNLIKSRVHSIKTPAYSVVAGSIVIFTDGTDRAARISESNALSAVNSTTDEISIFTIGLGGEINKSSLTNLGRDGSEFADQTGSLTSAFEKLSKRVLDESNSYYVFQYCSPKRSGTHELKIEILKDNKQGVYTKQFSANGFTGGCKID